MTSICRFDFPERVEIHDGDRVKVKKISAMINEYKFYRKGKKRPFKIFWVRGEKIKPNV